MKKKEEKGPLEEALKELETIVGALESDKLPLDEGIKQFEKGVQLYKHCKTLLGKAEKKVKILTEDLKEEDL